MKDKFETLARNPQWNAILDVVDKSYPDDLIGIVWKDLVEKGSTDVGDGLAEFIVRELADTFDETKSYLDQIVDATHTVYNVYREISDLHAGLRKSLLDASE